MERPPSLAGRIWSTVKTWFICHTFLTLTFLLSGLILNVFQVAAYLTIRPFSKHAYRKMNYYFIYTSWSHLVALSQWWSGTRIRVWGTKEDLYNLLKEHHLVLMNHTYEVDWLMCWIICDQFKMLANAKTFAKKSLMYVPIIGWNWALSEHIFLERSWEKDKLTLGSKLDTLIDYKDKILLLLFAEGTRFSEAKHKSSLEFAEKKNLPKLQHHLLPRPRGFNFCAKHFKDRGSRSICDIQLGFFNSPNPPKMTNIVNGRPIVADMYFRLIPLDKIPTDDDEACAKFLYDHYVEKDKLMDEYLKTGKFPSEVRELPVRIWPLLNLVGWLLMIGMPCLYAFYVILTQGSTFTIVVFSTFVALVFSVLNWMVGLSEINNSSSYGANSQTSRKGSTNDGPAQGEQSGNKPEQNGDALPLVS
ncbi:1-acyl-sn-glycerol-3-phosphate acyltransferase delta-like [Ornithodoros turicata]|uniref:1-acyl-sn-glycerol-3-phosphate acyltransferase delta-like n=1 Tax=Ornithodoros turicata TaxID=34597 RepID=UPI00313A39AD